MGELYEKQKDGSFLPIKSPNTLTKKLKAYLWMKGHKLTLEEIKFISSKELNIS